ncbi:hypothetical protein J3T99_07840 [Acetobacteraceae bacterium B3987]|nr:hypothetical protein [Acetobacteraceae bacterium B3987]
MRVLQSSELDQVSGGHHHHHGGEQSGGEHHHHHHSFFHHLFSGIKFLFGWKSH